MRTTVILLFLVLSTFCIKADPPIPPVGYRWVLQMDYSDEFNGNQLDKTKWNNYYNGWEGRSPGKFIPDAVSVKDGTMQIKNSVLKEKSEHTKSEYSIGGGAVQSKRTTAHFGYYEVSFKASRVNMSTTFWMSNHKTEVDYVTRKSNGENCDKDMFSQELDICESIGGIINSGDKFRKNMNFNTHFRYIDCNGGREKFYSKGNNSVEGSGLKNNAILNSESWEDFHTYGAFWKNANEVTFYADNILVGNVMVSTEVIDEPFDRPMHINMVTETYDWAKPYPTNEQLRDDRINTSYYDWVRSYKLVPVLQKNKEEKLGFKLYDERIEVLNELKCLVESKSLELEYVYSCNRNAEIRVTVGDEVEKLQSKTLKAHQGYGHGKYSIDLDFNPESSKQYKLTVQLIDSKSGEELSKKNYNL
ncbi:MAG: family 16 glycosylhydrolase [Reichenbachiella sp.]